MNLAPRLFSHDQNEAWDAIKLFGRGEHSGMKDASSARESHATSRRAQTNELRPTPSRRRQPVLEGGDGRLCRPGRAHGARARVHRASGRSAACGTQESRAPAWMWVLTLPVGSPAAPMNTAAHARRGERLARPRARPNAVAGSAMLSLRRSRARQHRRQPRGMSRTKGRGCCKLGSFQSDRIMKNDPGSEKPEITRDRINR